MASYVGFHGNPAMQAGGNISPCRFVKIGGRRALTQCSAAADVAFGISGEGVRLPPNFLDALSGQSVTNYVAIEGEEFEYFGMGQYALLECGTAWTYGAKLSPDSDGKGAPANGTNPVAAIALDNASAGEFSLVRIVSGQPNS